MSRADGDRSLVDDAREERRDLERGGIPRPARAGSGGVQERPEVQALLDAAAALEAGTTDVPARVAVPLAAVLRRAGEHARVVAGAGWFYTGDVAVALAILDRELT